jgi:outer membrane protein OmpA-like peptidoglycan-associated protein
VVFPPQPVKVNFIQTSQRLAQKQDLKVQEKYALILFDFDKDTIDARNQEIVNQVVARIRKLPRATVEIVGHTDNIGKEAYNSKLSDRRALAVYKLVVAAYGEAPGDRIRYSGVGPNTPLYDNLSPEARAFNRTVTITLEYLSAE